MIPPVISRSPATGIAASLFGMWGSPTSLLTFGAKSESATRFCDARAGHSVPERGSPLGGQCARYGTPMRQWSEPLPRIEPSIDRRERFIGSVGACRFRRARSPPNHAIISEMRVLLDTNIVIHREAAYVARPDIGILFRWLDRLQCEKWIHPLTIAEIGQHQDERVRRSFTAKLGSYQVLGVLAPIAPQVAAIGTQLDKTVNDRNDTQILNEVYCLRADLLITEDRGITRKAERLGVAQRVFTIDSFLEKVLAENPDLVDYKVLAVRRQVFGAIDVSDSFFDSFRQEYLGFNDWFNRKSQDSAYVCYRDGRIVAFLYLKLEEVREPYPDIVPSMAPRRRLKIGTLKVDLNGLKLGERFLKIVFDNALRMGVDEIYVTIFPRGVERERLIGLLEDFGFRNYGEKRSESGSERVYVRNMVPAASSCEPRTTFPYVSSAARAFLVPIYPKYHTELFPDSILRTESPLDFIEQNPHRNAIRKVYVSRSVFRNLASGDAIVFYRTGDGGPALHTAVVTTLGIVEHAHLDIREEDDFIERCRKRSVFADDQLREHWNYNRHNRPFVVDFLYAYSFPKRPNLKALVEGRVISDTTSAPRGFEAITNEQLATIFRLATADPRIVVNQTEVR